MFLNDTISKITVWSRRRDLNPRPPAYKSGDYNGLDHGVFKRPIKITTDLTGNII